MKKILKYMFTVIIFVCSVNRVYAGDDRKSSLRSFGDYMQIVNPVIAAGAASQESGIGHFGIIYAQSLVASHSIKFIANNAKAQISKRPRIPNKKDRYDGMPSAHTASAWAAASYTRIFSRENKYFCVPLYITAAITGYSRVKAKEHTTAQVITGALLTEAITYINSKLSWSENYKVTNFYINGDEFSAGFKINL